MTRHMTILAVMVSFCMAACPRTEGQTLLLEAEQFQVMYEAFPAVQMPECRKRYGGFMDFPFGRFQRGITQRPRRADAEGENRKRHGRQKYHQKSTPGLQEPFFVRKFRVAWMDSCQTGLTELIDLSDQHPVQEIRRNLGRVKRAQATDVDNFL